MDDILSYRVLASKENEPFYQAINDLLAEGLHTPLKHNGEVIGALIDCSKIEDERVAEFGGQAYRVQFSVRSSVVHELGLSNNVLTHSLHTHCMKIILECGVELKTVTCFDLYPRFTSAWR